MREIGYTSFRDQCYLDQATAYPSLNKQTSSEPNADLDIDTVHKNNDEDNEETGAKEEQEVEEMGEQEVEEMGEKQEEEKQTKEVEGEKKN